MTLLVLSSMHPDKPGFGDPGSAIVWSTDEQLLITITMKLVLTFHAVDFPSNAERYFSYRGTHHTETAILVAAPIHIVLYRT